MAQLKAFFSFIVCNALIVNNLAAQKNDADWKSVNEYLYSIAYPSKSWQPLRDTITGAVFTIFPNSSIKKTYDKDLIKLRILENADNLYGSLDEYSAQNQAAKKENNSPIISAERVKKGTLEYHEKIEKNEFGKIKRRIKERYFFVNQKVYELTFDAEEGFFNQHLAQADSIFNTFTINDFAATTVSKWLVFNQTSYEISYPDNWKLAEILPAHTEFMLYVPKKSDDKGYWDNIYLMVNTFKETTPELGNYAQRATEQLKLALKNGSILQSTRKKTANFNYQEVISEGLLGKNPIKMRQWHFVKGKKAYTLTYTARQEHFEDLMPIVNEIFNSFKLK
jgi:hypothetical protein